MEDAKSFCCHLIWVLTPSPPQLIQLQRLPLSFSFTHKQVHVCLYLLVKGPGGGPYHTTAKQMRFSSLLLFHAYSYSISNLVLAVPSTEILKWITDFHTFKHFTYMKHTHSYFPNRTFHFYFLMENCKCV